MRALTGGSVHHDRTDPIFNFLFEYYHFKPRILMQWTPGFDVHLLEADPASEGAVMRSVREVYLEPQSQPEALASVVEHYWKLLNNVS